MHDRLDRVHVDRHGMLDQRLVEVLAQDDPVAPEIHLAIAGVQRQDTALDQQVLGKARDPSTVLLAILVEEADAAGHQPHHLLAEAAIVLPADAEAQAPQPSIGGVADLDLPAPLLERLGLQEQEDQPGGGPERHAERL